jgi:competence protein ComEA
MAGIEQRSRVRVGIGAAVVLVLVAFACAVLFATLTPSGSSTSVAAGSLAPTTSTAVPTGVATAKGTTIYVHILGAVTKPGLYELRDGDRAVDAIAAAGGFTKHADQSSLNLARFITDGEQIVVPVEGAQPTTAATSGAAGAPGATGAKVSLNSADLTSLETLPRIGPALAQRIIDWRTQNGGFTSVNDLKSVSGIGDKTFDGLKDLVTL